MLAMRTKNIPFSTMLLQRQSMRQNHQFMLSRCKIVVAGVASGGLSIAEIQRDLRTGQRTATEVAKEYVDRAIKYNDSISSFIMIDAEGSLENAKRIDRKIRNGEEIGPLAGVPIAIKDNICTKGIATTAGSKILRNYVPPYDSVSVSKLHAADALIIGKTNMDEFGMGSSTENSGFFPTQNPWNPKKVPGGSSGGSAAAVAAGQCLVALGSDTGGSIRQPAHFCGVVGLKPTYGRVSRRGLISYASSLDVIGPMGKCITDVASVLSVIAGPDPLDSTSSQRNSEDFLQYIDESNILIEKPLKGKKIGLIKETFGDGVDDEIQEAIKNVAKQLEMLGAAIEELTLPSFRLGLPAYYVIAASEASSNLSRYDGLRYGSREFDSKDLNSMYLSNRSVMGDEVRRRIIMGTYALSAGYYNAYYKRAQQVRSLIKEEVEQTLNVYDALLCPTAPTAAYYQQEKKQDPLSMYKGDLMTVNVNLAGLPALTFPCGFSSDMMPIGAQLIGNMWDEGKLLQIGRSFEAHSGLKFDPAL